MTRQTQNGKDSLTLLRLSAVVVAWSKRDHLEPPKLTAGRCDACLKVFEIVWEKSHKRICFDCASGVIKQAAETGDNDSVHSLHVLLDDERFTERRNP